MRACSAWHKCLSLVLLCSSIHCARAQDPLARERSQRLYGSYCTYSAAPRLPDQRVDVQRLVSELIDLHANTYRWVAHPGETNLQDLKAFLPLARAHNLRVWVTVNPPSERRAEDMPPPSERLAEYEAWGKNFARLSLVETNFVAWSIDDFVWNLKFFTPEATRRIVAAACQINPQFAFLPCCYFKGATTAFARDYGPFCDGIMFPYRDESGGANLTNSTRVASEVKAVREKFGPSCPVILGVFASRHSKLGLSAPDYVERVMVAAHECADGVSVFRHPNRATDPEKYEIVKRLFTAWTAPK